jgi:sterol desaturase/sphingolipid hydroxylase (fatty acid hydroxylase superfamily)
LAILTTLLGGCYVGVQAFVHANLPFLEVGLIDGLPAWAQLIVLLLVIDFAFYVFHRIMHSTKPLWLFHAVHHAASRPNPMLQNRGHIVDQALFTTLSLPFLLAILGAPPPVFFTYVMIDQFWDYFQHSDIKVNLGPLKYVISTPQYHRIHHSLERRHFDKNFSGRLIVWDYLFGTLHPCFDEYPEIGIEGYPVVEESTSPIKVVGYALANFLYPFQALWRHFVSQRSATADVAAEPVESALEEKAIENWAGGRSRFPQNAAVGSHAESN